MLPNTTTTANVLANNAPEINRELLIEQKFYGIIQSKNEDTLFLAAIKNEKYRKQILNLLYK